MSMSVYVWRGMHTEQWVQFFKLSGWVYVRFLGITIGNYYIGIQRFTRDRKVS